MFIIYKSYYHDLSPIFNRWSGLLDDEAAWSSLVECGFRWCCARLQLLADGRYRYVVAQNARMVLWERTNPRLAGWGGRTLYPQHPALSVPPTPRPYTHRLSVWCARTFSPPLPPDSRDLHPPAVITQTTLSASTGAADYAQRYYDLTI